jgi:malonate-semialdehyde dehydrogenase (acetylating)/methylmalonate-semialdehyde dehydrogenase
MAIAVAVFVGDAIADDVLGRVQKKIAAMKVGASDDRAAEMGPLVTAAHRDKVAGYIDAGVAEGAQLLADGRTLKVPGHEDGYFVGPTLFDRVEPRMRIYKDEIFGPVLSTLRVGSYDEALALINAHEFGNGAAIFTRDGDTARDFVSRVQIGMIGVNVPIPVPVAYHSFGGWKSSLFGDHHIYGPESVRFYTRQKAVTQRWPSGIRAGADFMMPTTK